MACRAAGTSGKTCRLLYSSKMFCVSPGERVAWWMDSAALKLFRVTELKGWYWPMLFRRHVYSSCWMRHV